MYASNDKFTEWFPLSWPEFKLTTFGLQIGSSTTTLHWIVRLTYWILYDKLQWHLLQSNGSVNLYWLRPENTTTPDLGQEMETEAIWPHLKVFWLSKDSSAAHSERKRKKR